MKIIYLSCLEINGNKPFIMLGLILIHIKLLELPAEFFDLLLVKPPKLREILNIKIDFVVFFKQFLNHRCYLDPTQVTRRQEELEHIVFL